MDDALFKRYALGTVSGESVLASQSVNELLQWHQFLLFNQVKFLNKEDEVLERCVEMRLFLKLDYLLKVLMIDVRIDTEKAL